MVVVEGIDVSKATPEVSVELMLGVVEIENAGLSERAYPSKRPNRL